MWLVIALGVLVGLPMGMTGAGGGMLAVPLLVFGLGLSITQAVPIALLGVALAAWLAAVMGLRAGLVRYRAALLMAVAGVLIAPLGVWLSYRLDQRLLAAVFALVLVYVAYKTVRGRHEVALDTSLPCTLGEDTGRFVWTSRCSRSVLLSGGLAGFMSGLVGVGGGFVLVPALQRISPLGMRSVVATTLTVIALISTSIVTASLIGGQLDGQLALTFSIGAVTGMMLGRSLGLRLGGGVIRTGFALLALLAAGLLLTQTFF
ncbi:sulfite exporter TauE/SafE family protein [Methylobacillus flagellatus]|uniref:sulfite exporter TauE/SafE family protein n=1 Tax=Methylobacillus flagellatus TaxID=405 RepID=UPI0010F918D4|nr:sulfite exporter TauE/SafE family protein [Methylobacillus flagellatus]